MSQYFTEEFNDFFKELAVNNHKEWFHENKKRYETFVKKPFYKLVEDLIEKYKAFEPDCELEVKNAVFRINRDIRFSKEKSPYKLHVSAVISKYGKKDRSNPGFFFHLSPGESFIGGGCYDPSKENLYKIRETIVQNPKQFQKVLADKHFTKLYDSLEPTVQNKIIPKEFKQAAQEEPLIFNKKFYFMQRYEDESFPLQENLLDVFENHFKAALPVIEYLKQAVH